MKRTNRTNILKLVLVLAGLSPLGAASGELQVYLGDPSQSGRIRRFAEGSGAPLPVQPELRGLRLLPLDYNGRLGQDLANPLRPHLREDIPGAGRIELPGGLGVLYRFGRSVPGIAQRFGYLRILPDGSTQLLAERAGTGAGGAQSPYSDRVALAPDGKSMWIATTLAAGGNVIEIQLLNGSQTDRSASLAPLDLLPNSLRLQSDWGVAVASDGVLRGDLGPADELAVVALEAGTVFHSGTVVMSADGSKALTTAGASAATQHVWVFGRSGAVSRATRDARPMSGAGYLPDAPHGPFFAVDNDGILCAWRVEQLNSREVFVRRTTSPPNRPAAQVTSDANFTDTLDEAGILNMFQPGKLMMAVGEIGTDVGVGIEKVDFFEVTLDVAGVPTIRNITGSSGQFNVPYLQPPALGPLFLRWVPAAQSYVMYDEQSGGTGRLAAFAPGATGVQTLLADVKEVFFIEQLGNTLLISLRMSTGNKPHRLVRMPADLSSAPVVLLDTADSALLHAVADSSGWLACVEVPDLGLQRMHRYHVPSDTLQTFPLAALSYGPVLAWSPAGDLTFSLERAGQLFFAAWRTGGGGVYRLQATAPLGALLPGR